MPTPMADPHRLRDALQQWATGAMKAAGAVEITYLKRADGGQSSETWLVGARMDDAPRKWVLRIEPRHHQIYENASVYRQFRMAVALGAQGDLPVPAPLRYEPDEAVIGAPFFLMERADGVAPPNSYHAEGLFIEADAHTREKMWTDSIGLLARLHAIDPAPFAFLAWPGAPANDGIGQELARWDSYHTWSGVPASPLLDRARQWLERFRPPASPPGVAWGDARPCNILYANTRCSAMLDWETASMGGAETDLGWWIFYDGMIAEGVGIPRLPGIGNRAATIAAWEHCSGRRAQNMEWHILFAAWRFALVSERAGALARAAGRYPAGVPQANPAIQYLDRLLAEAGAS